MGTIIDAARFIQEGNVKLLNIDKNKIIFQVGSYLVVKQKKAGRVEDTCSCTNHSKFPGARCSHKEAATTYCVMKKLKWFHV